MKKKTQRQTREEVGYDLYDIFIRERTHPTRIYLVGTFTFIPESEQRDPHYPIPDMVDIAGRATVELNTMVREVLRESTQEVLERKSFEVGGEVRLSLWNDRFTVTLPVRTTTVTLRNDDTMQAELEIVGVNKGKLIYEGRR